MTKYEQRIGQIGQNHAANALRGIGVMCVEKIATPVRLLPARAKGTFKVVWGEVVSGDHRGIIPGKGTSVLAETKTILDRNLRYSDLRDHQPERLTEHHENNGISLLVWVHSTGIYIMRWPITYFVKGKSITPEEASLLNVESL